MEESPILTNASNTSTASNKSDAFKASNAFNMSDACNMCNVFNAFNLFNAWNINVNSLNSLNPLNMSNPRSLIQNLVVRGSTGVFSLPSCCSVSNINGVTVSRSWPSWGFWCMCTYMYNSANKIN